MEFSAADVKIMLRGVAGQNDEDLEQEATLRAMQAFRGAAGAVRHPKAFLRKIVHDTVVDHWRRRRTYEDLDTVDEARLAQPCTAEIDMDRRRQREALHQAITTLDANKRATVNLFYSDDLSILEIARIQKKSQSAVKMELLRARRELFRIIVSLLNKSRGSRDFSR